jgi:hypothetical protein
MYNSSSGLGGPKYGMTGRQTRFHDEGVPGPGQYKPSLKLVTNEAPHYGVGSSPKIGGDKSTKRIVPGPGAYDQNKSPNK